MRDEVTLVEQIAAAGLRLGEYRVVRNGGAFCTSLTRWFRRTQPNTGQDPRIPHRLTWI